MKSEANIGRKEILPVNIETIVEARLGLYPDPLHDLFSTTYMDAYLKMDLSGIVVDYGFYMNEKFANRIRFSFAHELGHYFLHKDLYSKINLISAQDWKYFIINIPEIEYRDFEWQALMNLQEGYWCHAWNLSRRWKRLLKLSGQRIF